MKNLENKKENDLKLERLFHKERNAWRNLKNLNENQKMVEGATNFLIKNNCKKELKNALIAEVKKMRMQEIEIKEKIILINEEIKEIQ